jgi:conjugative transfer region protein TrbK
MMRTSTIARMAAVAFVATVVTITALEMREAPTASVTSAPVVRGDAQADPLRAALTRCQSTGMAAARDGACLRAWAENRRRFLAPGARPQAMIEPALPDNSNVAALNVGASTGELR